jgi:hypothetical protein
MTLDLPPGSKVHTRFVSNDRTPIACTLTSADEMDERLRDWQRALSNATSREAVDGGVRLRFGNDPAVAANLARLAALEVGCCGWLDFRLAVAAEATTLDVRAPEEGMAVLLSLFGPAS